MPITRHTRATPMNPYGLLASLPTSASERTGELIFSCQANRIYLTGSIGVHSRQGSTPSFEIRDTTMLESALPTVQDHSQMEDLS